MEIPARKFKILFLCTRNASRSIFAEYFMKDIGSDRFETFSAGVGYALRLDSADRRLVLK
jgi:protein-tyrosine-phosphatase